MSAAAVFWGFAYQVKVGAPDRWYYFQSPIKKQATTARAGMLAPFHCGPIVKVEFPLPKGMKR